MSTRVDTPAPSSGAELSPAAVKQPVDAALRPADAALQPVITAPIVASTARDVIWDDTVVVPVADEAGQPIVVSPLPLKAALSSSGRPPDQAWRGDWDAAPAGGGDQPDRAVHAEENSPSNDDVYLSAGGEAAVVTNAGITAVKLMNMAAEVGSCVKSPRVDIVDATVHIFDSPAATPAESPAPEDRDEAWGPDEVGWGALAPEEEEDPVPVHPAAASAGLDAGATLSPVVFAAGPLAAAAATWAQARAFSSSSPAPLLPQPVVNASDPAVEQIKEEGPSAAEVFLEQQLGEDEADKEATGGGEEDLDDAWILADLVADAAAVKGVAAEGSASPFGPAESPCRSSGSREDAYGINGETGTVRAYVTSRVEGSVTSEDAGGFGLNDAAHEGAEAAVAVGHLVASGLRAHVPFAPQRPMPFADVPDSEVVVMDAPHRLSPVAVHGDPLANTPFSAPETLVAGQQSGFFQASACPPPTVPMDLFTPSGPAFPSVVVRGNVLGTDQVSPATPSGARCAVSFGFGGRVTVVAAPRTSDRSWAPIGEAASPQGVRVYALSDVMAVSVSVDVEAALEATAPLESAAATRQAYVPLCERMAARASSVEAATLWRVLAMANRRPCEWQSGETVADMAAALLGPNSSVILGSRLPAVVVPSASPLLPAEREDEPLLRRRAGRVQQLVTSGSIATAQALASDGELWPLALVLASATGGDGGGREGQGGGECRGVRGFSDATCAFAAALCVESSPLRTLCEVAAGGVLTAVSASGWAKSASALIGFGHRKRVEELADGGGQARGHVCRLLGQATGERSDSYVAAARAGTPVLFGGLGGAPGYSTAAVLATLVWEASQAAALGPPQAAAAAVGGTIVEATLHLPGGLTFPALMPHRLELASAVAAVGRLRVAAQQVAAIFAGVREALKHSAGWPLPGAPAFLGALRDLEVRIATAEAGRDPPSPPGAAGEVTDPGGLGWGGSHMFSSSATAPDGAPPAAPVSEGGRSGSDVLPRRLDGLLSSTVKVLIGAGDEAGVVGGDWGGATGVRGGADPFPPDFAPLGGAHLMEGSGTLSFNDPGLGFMSTGPPHLGPAPALGTSSPTALLPWVGTPAESNPTLPGRPPTTASAGDQIVFAIEVPTAASGGRDSWGNPSTSAPMIRGRGAGTEGALPYVPGPTGFSALLTEGDAATVPATDGGWSAPPLADGRGLSPLAEGELPVAERLEVSPGGEEAARAWPPVPVGGPGGNGGLASGWQAP